MYQSVIHRTAVHTPARVYGAALLLNYALGACHLDIVQHAECRLLEYFSNLQRRNIWNIRQQITQ